MCSRNFIAVVIHLLSCLNIYMEMKVSSYWMTWGFFWVSVAGPASGLPPSLRDTISDIDLTAQRMSSSEFYEMRAAMEDQFDLANMAIDPIELAGLFEGDVLPDVGTPYNATEGGAQEKNTVVETSRLWPDGVVPYKFSAEFLFLPLERYLIRKTMSSIADRSCVQFVERTSHHDDYVKIIYDTNKCYSHIGRQGGVQVLSLGFFCTRWWNLGTVYHELLHTVGFYHEHNRPDRDQYVSIKWDNISKGNKKNFIKRDYGIADLIDVPYDIGSVMHYQPYAFAKWRYITPTVVSHQHGTSFKRPSHPSKKDYVRLNRLYRCYWEGRHSYSSIGDTGPPPKWYFVRGVQPPHFTSHTSYHFFERSPNHVDMSLNIEPRVRHRVPTTNNQSFDISSLKTSNNFSSTLSHYISPAVRFTPPRLQQTLQLLPPLNLHLLPPPPPPPAPLPTQHNSFMTISSIIDQVPFTEYSLEFEEKLANIRSLFDDDDDDNDDNDDDDEAETTTQAIFDDVFINNFSH
ncbi:uncharacterized protein LOC143036641 isoform X2 [Oratosquilla oratoria]|uniref:uncharacterized protein LOC143036641 isoform X2 n=1 Tax=Oratosquilla oratoria TaxID=337810 RepID=UPI003F763B76